MSVIVVTGIPGVGKTTVMQKAAEGMDIKFVTFGTVMMDIAKETGLVKDRDEMRKLTLEQQKQLQIKSAEKIAQMGNVILDTHCTVKTQKGYMPGLPEWIVKRINPTAIIVVEADPEEIFNRRAKDPTRNRDPDTKEQIELIKILEKKGFTYKIKDGVYFDTSKIKEYKNLLGIKKENIEEGARVEKVKGKKNATDFALWKLTAKGVKLLACGKNRYEPEKQKISLVFYHRGLFEDLGENRKFGSRN